MNGAGCQLHCMESFALRPRLIERAARFPKRLRRFLNRRITFAVNRLKALSAERRPGLRAGSPGVAPIPLAPGDIVRIRTRPEIERTLSPWNDLRGCGFMEEMWAHCGTTRRIYKPVRTFLDERHYHLRRCAGVYLLEGVQCSGTKDFGPCDRSCYFFWREEWLQRLPGESATPPTRQDGPTGVA